MASPTVLCPCCGKRLVCSYPPEPGQAMRCHGCGRGFTVPGKSPEHRPAVAPRRFPIRAAGIILGVASLTAGGIVLAMAYFGQPVAATPVAEAAPAGVTPAPAEALRADPPAPAVPPPPVQGNTEINLEIVPPEAKPDPVAEPMPVMPEMPEPAPVPQDVLIKDWLPKKEQAIVNEAIKRGVTFLKKNQFPDGSWGRGHPVGVTALPALALLECGVPASDTSIRRAANFVRKSVPSLDRTYEISLAILFLDRLRAAEDRARIVTLSLRLLAGQQEDGGWSYTCPILNRTEETNLLIALRATRPISPEDLFVKTGGAPLLDLYLPKETSSKSLKLTLEEQNPQPSSKMVEIALSGVGSGPRADADEGARPPEPEGPPPPPPEANKPEKPVPAPAGKAEAVAPEIRRVLDKLPERLRRIPALSSAASLQKRSTDIRGRMVHARTDNSNTQFAIIGLWAARRHHVPMDRALAMIVWRFHSSQHTDGSWQYHYVPTRTDGTGRATMTGAALIGLGVGYGLTLPNGAPRERGIPQNPQLVDGLKALGDSLANDAGRGRGGRGRGGVDLYYWWTVERVAVLYGLRSFQGRPWYEAGVAEVIPSQKPDGSWMYHGGSPQPIGTSFALLFLKGSNLVSDLSQTIKGEPMKK